jgi:hypothetical protein
MIGILWCLAMTPLAAQEPAWNAASIKECDRACLAGIMDGYLNALVAHNPKGVPPLALDVRMTENTGQMDVSEGVLWRSKVEPTEHAEIFVLRRELCDLCASVATFVR